LTTSDSQNSSVETIGKPAQNDNPKNWCTKLCTLPNDYTFLTV